MLLIFEIESHAVCICIEVAEHVTDDDLELTNVLLHLPNFGIPGMKHDTQFIGC